jgi:2Fe-2S ferredoxin
VATVRFTGQGLEVEVPLGTTLLDAARQARAPLGSACGGVCACSTCHVYIESGQDLLSPAGDDEEDRLDGAFDVRMNSRLGCQARVESQGLVLVKISRESLETYQAEHPEPGSSYTE